MSTWRWLGINDASLDDINIAKGSRLEPTVTYTEGVGLNEAFDIEQTSITMGMDKKLDFVREHCNSRLTVSIPAGMKLEKPVIIEYKLNDINNSLAEGLHIDAGKNSSATVVVRYTAEGSAKHFHGGFTYIDVEAGAELKLIKVQSLPGRDTHVDAVDGIIAEGGKADVILCELGSANGFADCNIRLVGKGSNAEVNGLYLGDKRKKLDLNYRIVFMGRETEGAISVKGALSGEARKTLKSTIDFVRGSKGAKGREDETVLALSDKVVNVSSPLLLCGEDDVEGEHATSTGKPDAAKLYYLMSRGFSERDAKKLLVEASFTPILGRIDMPELENEVKAYIQEVINGE